MENKSFDGRDEKFIGKNLVIDSSEHTLRKVTAFDVGLTPGEAEQFLISKMENSFRNYINYGKSFCKLVKAGADAGSPKLINLHKQFTTELLKTLDCFEKNVDIILALSRNSGILEGVNGYRSLLLILYRILSKLTHSMKHCPANLKQAQNIDNANEILESTDDDNNEGNDGVEDTEIEYPSLSISPIPIYRLHNSSSENAVQKISNTNQSNNGNGNLALSNGTEQIIRNSTSHPNDEEMQFSCDIDNEQSSMKSNSALPISKTIQYDSPTTTTATTTTTTRKRTKITSRIPFRRFSISLPSFSSLESELFLKGWISKNLELVKQMTVMCELVEILCDKKNEHFFDWERETDPESIQEEESQFLSLIGHLSMDCFFGVQFGTQYSSDIRKIMKMIILANASFVRSKKATNSNNHNAFIRGTKALMYGLYYGTFPEEAAEQVSIARSIEDVWEMKEFWNLTENTLTEKASILWGSLVMDMKLVLPSVSLCIPCKKANNANDRTIPLETIVLPAPSLPVNARYLSGKLFTVNLDEENKNHLLQRRQSFYSSVSDRDSNGTVNQNNLTSTTTSTTSPVSTMSSTPSRIRKGSRSFSTLEIGSSFNFPEKKSSPMKQEPVKSSNNTSSLANALIIHFHGGGFIAHTSISHLMYLRKWAKETNIPILTVEYRLAPEFPYPVAFDECYFAYQWALQNPTKLGTTGERIILVGDSAGGNLATAVTLRAIADRTRVPDGLLLIYPTLYMRFVPSPSRLLSLIDPMLSLNTLRCCLKAYLPKDNAVELMRSPYVSPVCATDDLLRQMPDKVYIVCGTLDPLFDDSIFFAKRLLSVGKHCQLKIFDGFPHGFLNLASVPSLGKEMHSVVKMSATWIQEILNP